MTHWDGAEEHDPLALGYELLGAPKLAEKRRRTFSEEREQPWCGYLLASDGRRCLCTNADNHVPGGSRYGSYYVKAVQRDGNLTRGSELLDAPNLAEGRRQYAEELADRLRQAADNLGDLAAQASVAWRAAHLDSKADGVLLALSYVEEELRG